MASTKKVVRKIKATTNDGQPSKPVQDKTAVKVSTSNKESDTKKVAVKPVQKTTPKKSAKPKTSNVEPNEPVFILKPFVKIGRYIRDSWRELRQVEWPNRRATWQLTLGVIIFCVVIGLFVLAIDWVSSLLIKEVIL